MVITLYVCRNWIAEDVVCAVLGKACVTDVVTAMSAKCGAPLQNDFNAVAVENVASTYKQTKSIGTDRADTLLLIKQLQDVAGVTAVLGEDKKAQYMHHGALKQMMKAWSEIWSEFSYNNAVRPQD